MNPTIRMNSTGKPVLSKVCPRCQSAMICEIEQGKSHCWCFDEPRTLKPDEVLGEWQPDDEMNTAKSCLCRRCLTDIQREKANQSIQNDE